MQKLTIEKVKAILEYTSFSVPELARLTGYDVSYIYRILDGKFPMTEEFERRVLFALDRLTDYELYCSRVEGLRKIIKGVD